MGEKQAKQVHRGGVSVQTKPGVTVQDFCGKQNKTANKQKNKALWHEKTHRKMNI